jgi:cell fate (sporulation/competence/biofilm development) regulator YlbF (YheA/YmcA/DUF963 family)
MSVIEKARELGEEIMDDARCRRLQAAKAANDADTALQEMIGEFNLKKMQLGSEFNKPQEQQSKERMAQYENELKEIYGRVMQNEAMAEFTAAKKDMDELLEHVNAIIQVAVSGEADSGGCGGDCAGCAGCH